MRKTKVWKGDIEWSSLLIVCTQTHLFKIYMAYKNNIWHFKALSDSSVNNLLVFVPFQPVNPLIFHLYTELVVLQSIRMGFL